MTKLERYIALISRLLTCKCILHWVTLNNLKRNFDKTKAIVIGPYFYINKLSNMETNGIRFVQIS